MKIIVVLACLTLGSAALSDGHGGVFANPRVSDERGGVIKINL
ncbi:MAG: hypothetical protein OYH77_06545 [Pseudomonadota bacterium]|nr:hypothetical protein [Pseudomonadota bacterium]